MYKSEVSDTLSNNSIYSDLLGISLLKKEEYTRASGMVQLIPASRYLLSPVLSGLVLSFAGIRPVIMLDILTILITLPITYIVRKEMRGIPKGEGTKLAEDLSLGFHLIYDKKGLWLLVMLGILVSFCLGTVQTLMIPMLLPFGGESFAGFATTVSACGMLVGGLILSRFSIKKDFSHILQASLLGMGFFMAAFAWGNNKILICGFGFCLFMSLPFANAAMDYLVRVNVATTHQLLKFYQAFDLLIVDEVDAFPYVDNSVLYYAVNQCVKEEGLRIFLTATSTDELDKKVRTGELKRLSLPRRFHGNPLIIPKPVWLSDFNRYIEKSQLSPKLKSYIKKQRRTGYPLLIFASEIKKGEKLKELLQEQFPNENIGFVSSVTENRLEQVQAFRDGELTILISTTILERGVTFPCVDVFVVEANHRLFTKSSLIQIGGRVGRSMDRPTGELLFFHDGLNVSIKKAIKEIKQMNKEAGL